MKSGTSDGSLHRAPIAERPYGYSQNTLRLQPKQFHRKISVGREQYQSSTISERRPTVISLIFNNLQHRVVRVGRFFIVYLYRSSSMMVFKKTFGSRIEYINILRSLGLSIPFFKFLGFTNFIRPVRMECILLASSERRG